MLTFRLDDIEQYVTEQGCLVRSYRQCNAYGEESEHVTLSTTFHEEPSITHQGDSHVCESEV